MVTEHHEMNIIEVYPTKAERWECPDCGRQMVVQWHPFKRILLQSGDEIARHSAIKGGLEIKNVDIYEDNFPADLKDQINDILNQVD